MIPQNNGDLLRDFAFQELPTRTFRINPDVLGADAQDAENTLYVFDGGLPAMVDGIFFAVDGGSPSDIEVIALLYDGGNPEQLPEDGKLVRPRETVPWTGTIAGFVDGIDAMKQAIYLILNTERYAYIVYSWNYGVELADLIGKPIPFVMSEAKRRITEALMQDTRIKGVSDFAFESQGSALQVTFTVHTIFGDIETDREVVV